MTISRWSASRTTISHKGCKIPLVYPPFLHGLPRPFPEQADCLWELKALGKFLVVLVPRHRTDRLSSTWLCQVFPG